MKPVAFVLSHTVDVAGLAGERSRWEVSIVSLDLQLAALPGDVALASAFMSYAGPFPSQYREALAKDTWQKQVCLAHPLLHQLVHEHLMHVNLCSVSALTLVSSGSNCVKVYAVVLFS